MTSTLFITGATSGFGEACARKFAQAGWKLVLTGRREERLKALCEELSKQTEVHGLVVDVRDRAAMEAAIAGLPPSFSTVALIASEYLVPSWKMWPTSIPRFSSSVP